MSHYLDIQLRPDPETTAHQLMAALYAKLHRALVLFQSDTIGVSFPGYVHVPAGLGPVLRLIAPEDDLRRLMEHDWLKGVRDHVDVSGLKPVPEACGYRGLRRIQAKSNPERLRRRQMRRHGLTEEQARQRVPDSAAERLPWPFIQLRSASTGEQFRLYLRLDTDPADRLPGTFNTYGLSATATLPWF